MYIKASTELMSGKEEGASTESLWRERELTSGKCVTVEQITVFKTEQRQVDLTMWSMSAS